MQLNMMDEWLNTNSNASYNLGESGVSALTIQEIFDMTHCKQGFLQLDFEHNDCRGSYELRKEICALYNNATPDEVLVTTGVTEAILVYFNTIYKPNSNVIVIAPAFHNLYDLPESRGFEVRKIFLKYENQFRLPIQEIEAALDQQTRAIVLTSPSNPLGTICSKEEFDNLLQIVSGYDCDVVVDEHYRLMSNDLPSFFSQTERIICFGSPGKCLGCVGLRVGWLVARQEIINLCLDYKSLTTHAIFKGSDYLALQILKHRNVLKERFQNWIDQNINCFKEFQLTNYRFIEWIEPEAGTVAFPRLKRTNNSFGFAEELLQKTGVLVLPGECFDMPGFFRIRLGVNPIHFQEAIRRMHMNFASYL